MKKEVKINIFTKPIQNTNQFEIITNIFREDIEDYFYYESVSVQDNECTKGVQFTYNIQAEIIVTEIEVTGIILNNLREFNFIKEIDTIYI